MNKFERFLENRQSLIFQYKKGDLSKEEFIEANYNFIESLGIKPFQRVDNVKKAVYNYQYYNVIAKYYHKRAQETNHSDARRDFQELSNYYYSKKDKVTEQLLKLVDYKGVDSYYVKVRSPHLKRKLIEIVLKDFDNLVLHTKSRKIVNLLMEEKAFTNEVKTSIVDSYINQKY